MADCVVDRNAECVSIDTSPLPPPARDLITRLLTVQPELRLGTPARAPRGANSSNGSSSSSSSGWHGATWHGIRGARPQSAGHALPGKTTSGAVAILDHPFFEVCHRSSSCCVCRCVVRSTVVVWRQGIDWETLMARRYAVPRLCAVVALCRGVHCVASPSLCSFSRGVPTSAGSESFSSLPADAGAATL